MLIAENIIKSYKSQEVLRGASLSVNDGEFVSIMGESGSGKSTLLGILGATVTPDCGEVTLFGESLTKMTDKRLSEIRRTRLGFVYQSLNLLPTLTAEENILLPLYLQKSDLFEGRKVARALAQRMNVEGQLGKLPHLLSGGQRQRIAIARAMIYSPEIILLDEPTGSLDSESTREVMELLRDINANDGVSILQVTHSRSAAEYGGRIINIKDGVIVE